MSSSLPCADEGSAELLSHRCSSSENCLFEYWAGNPSVELAHGYIRTLPSLTKVRNMGQPKAPEEDAEQTVVPTCAVLASSVPCSMSAYEFLDFLGAFNEETHRQFRNCRVLHGPGSEEYFVALQLSSPTAAAQLVERFDGRTFNALESGRCQLHPIAGHQGGLCSSVEVDDDFFSHDELAISESLFKASLTKFETSFCSVCLEHTEDNPDEYQVTEMGGGVPLTILCGHAFHARCLARWCDMSCPFCRYQQHPKQTLDSICDFCGHHDGLRICLVCGFVGCTLPDGSHALQHFEETRHTYALEVGTHRVWDYAGNGYVHRLLCNHQDGKMVEHSGGGASDLARSETLLGGRGMKKDESVINEFNMLLASQMTAQKHFYDEQRRELEFIHAMDLQKWKSCHCAQSSVAAEVQVHLDAIRMLETEIAEANADENMMKRQRISLEAVNAKISEEQRRYQEERADPSESRRSARQRRAKEIEELQQQVKDLTLYLQMRKQCATSADAAELQSSHMVVTEPSGRSHGGRRTKRR